MQKEVSGDEDNSSSSKECEGEVEEQEMERDSEENVDEAALSASGNTVSDVIQQPEEGPRRPALKKYPSQEFGNQQRNFIRGWFDWLEYSIMKDTTFCFACRHFLCGGHGFHSESTFTVIGYRNWPKATAAFKTHHVSAARKFAVEARAKFSLRKQDGSRLGSMLDKGHAKIVQENLQRKNHFLEGLENYFCYFRVSCCSKGQEKKEK
ncbi:uncharacterized protein LOC134336819 isoform X2 [Mobula hypostoma]|uniref:uncharacterized protein LOC134336819 isoform X2 n=1 Tax=Mobula hypostoma TaxID=723540 RepID=UPI002FC2EA48